MSLYHSPYVVTDGLILYLDAANPKSIKKRSNLLSWDSWTIGTGSVTGYTMNGTVDENRRILDTNPFGHSDVVWDTPSNDVTNDADGGWDGSDITIDPTKTYRFSTWVRRKIIGNGYFYLGCHGLTSGGSNIGVLYRSNGTVSTNPYFSATGWWGSANTWYLVVGHVWPVGSGTGATHVDSAIYNTAGTKVTTTQDFIWQSTSVKTRHRSYLYYSTDTTTNQQWYHPRIDLCDGTEPTISELLSNIENTWYDLSGNSNNGILTNGPKYTSANNGSLIFDGIDDHVIVNDCGISTGVNIPHTIEMWVNFELLTGTRWWLAVLGQYSSWSHHWIGLSSTNTQFGVWGATPQQCNPNLFGINQGLHIVITYDGISLKDYINGIYNTSKSATSFNFTNSNFAIAKNIVSEVPFKGRIGSAKIYNRALSANEISQNFAAHRGRYGI